MNHLLTPLVALLGALATLAHLLFFVMESLLWEHPAVKRIFRQDDSTIPVTKVLALNQGFYNLFLALGMGAGLAMLALGRPEGRVLVAYAAAFMVGAALVLKVSVPSNIRGVVLQGVPALGVLVGLWRGW